MSCVELIYITRFYGWWTLADLDLTDTPGYFINLLQKQIQTLPNTFSYQIPKHDLKERRYPFQTHK